jgi:hypothetical protein
MLVAAWVTFWNVLIMDLDSRTEIGSVPLPG